MIRPVALAATLALATLAGILSPAPAAAQADYPNRLVRVVVPYPAGGATDVVGRIVAEALAQAFGQQVIVENKGGAGGAIGAEAVARSAPDGYTLLIGSNATQVTNQFLRAKLNYDQEKDFEPIAMVSQSAMLFVAHPSVPAATVAELIAHARANPGRLHFGSAGSGATSHLAGELFKALAKVDIVHVPYRGAGPAMSDLIGGQVQLMFDHVETSLQNVRAGHLKAFAVSSAAPLAHLPDVPTVAATLPGYEALGFFSLMGPRGVPAAIVDKLNTAIREQLAKPDIARRMDALGQRRVVMTPRQVAEFLAAERVKWSAVIREAGLKAE